MRDRNQNYIQFCKQFRKEVSRKTTLSRSLRTTVTDNTTFPSDLLRIVYPRKFREIRGLVIVHYYLPEILMWEVKMGLEDLNLNHLNEKQILEIRILLSSERNMIKYLYLTDRYTSHEIFGNLVKDSYQAAKNLKAFPVSTKVRRTLRKRGYSDKGSLRPRERWLPTHDYSLTALQNEIEKKRTKLDKVSYRLINYLENWTN